MAASEETTAVLEDMVEVSDDLANLAEDLVRLARRQKVLIPTALIVGAGIGAFIGYRIASKKAALRYEILLEAKAKDFYAQKYKGEGFSTPTEALATLHGAEAAMQTYKPPAVPEVPDLPTEAPDDPRPPVETVVSNIFSDNEWNLEQEKSKRAANPDLPYVISHEEYKNNESGFQQIAIAYYEEDGILTDPADRPIDDDEGTVGKDNLMRFGHGSGDPRVVYIRNPREEVEFEVVKSQGSFDQEVLGLKHSDERRRPRRMRASDD